jgi:PAS domain-containing protein
LICRAESHSDLLPAPEENKWGYVTQIRRLDDLGRSAHADQVETALNIIKAGGRVDPHPTLIYKITRDGYRLMWCNAAWTEWTGLDFEESASGMDLETVDAAVREDVGAVVSRAGQAKIEMDLEYDLYRPHTGEMWGRIWVHGHPIHVADPEAWYYVSRLRKAEDRLTVPPPPT